MFARSIHLFLVVVWAFVGLFLLLRGTLFPDWVPEEGQARRLQLLMVAAFVFMFWNLFRLYLNWSNGKARREMEEMYARRVGPKADRVPDEPQGPAA